MAEHFFAHAPVISWMTWMKRRIWSSENQEPTPLSTELLKQPIQSPTGIQPTICSESNALEYSQFFQQFFYESSNPVALVIPATVLQAGIQSGLIQGCEIRDSVKNLSGIVFCLFTGNYKDQPVGLITWLCVHPSWRKKGMTNTLLRSIYKIAQPCKIHLWRNDGFLASPAPPVWNEWRIVRKKQSARINSQILHTSLIPQKVPHAKWRTFIMTEWMRANPTGVLLDHSTFPTRFVETYEYQLKPGVIGLLCVQPTFERERKTGAPWCEILCWAFNGLPDASQYSQSQYIERMIDVLPYGWFEAPAAMPHFQDGWISSGQSSWSIFGLDPGFPVQRPILSLCAN